MHSEEEHEGARARVPKRRRRAVRWVVGFLAAAVVLLVVAAAVISRTAGFRRFATSLIADAVTKATGRQLTIGKAPVLRLGLAPAVVAEEIVLSNAPWGSRREMARARKIELQARLLPLLGGRIVIERLVIVGLEVFLETDARGVGNWEFTPAVPAAEPSTRAGPPSLLSHLKVWELLMTESSFVLEQRPSGGQTRLAIERLRLSRNLIAPGNLNADLAITFNGVPISLSGTMGGPDALVPGGKPFPVKVEVRTSGGRATVDGVIGRAWEMRGVDVEVRVEVVDPVALGKVLGAGLPGGGPWRVEGRIRDAGGGYALDPMRVTVGDSTLAGSLQVGGAAGTSLKLAGHGIEVEPLLAAFGVKAGVSGRVGEFAAEVRTGGGTPREWVSNLAGQVHVGQGSVVVGGGTRIEVERAVLTESGSGLGVEAVGSVEGVPLSVSGTVGSVEALAFWGESFPAKVMVGTDGATVGVEGQVGGAGTSLRLAGSGIELAPLLAAFGVKSGVSGRVGEFAAEVRTSGATPTEWVRNVCGQVQVTQGSVVVGGSTRIEVERAVLTESGGGLGVEAAGSVGGVPLSVAGTVGSVGALVFGGAPLPVKVAATTSGGSATVDGVVSRLWEMKGVDVGVRAEVADPGALGRQLGVGLPGGGSWRVEGRVKDVEGGYALDPMQVTVGGSTLTGRVAVDLGAERPRVVAALTAPLLDLTTLAESAAPATEQAAGPTAATRAGGVFSTTPLPLTGLAAADVQMSLLLNRLALREHAEIGGVSVKALLADGRLTVEPIEVRTPGGTLTGSVRLDAKGDVSAKLTGSGIGLGALVTILGGKARATGGSTDVRVDLQSKGRSVHEWAAKLGGKVRIVIGPGRLDGEELDLGLGVMTKILALINPFHKKDKFTELRCAVVNVSVDRGVVDLAQRIVVATTKLSAVASGTVDLGREVLDLDVYTKASLSLSAGVSNFAGVVKVSGPLSKPSFSLAAKGAATTSLSVGAAVATVGLSLIGEDLVNKIIRRANCKDALAEPAPAPEGAGRPGGS